MEKGEKSKVKKTVIFFSILAVIVIAVGAAAWDAILAVRKDKQEARRQEGLLSEETQQGEALQEGTQQEGQLSGEAQQEELLSEGTQQGESLQNGEAGRSSSKAAVLALESDDLGKKVPAGDWETMRRLAIVRDGAAVFEMKKAPSENEENFQEWYLTEPYSYKQLINVSELYDFLKHYAAWDVIREVDADTDIGGFQASGLCVEEEFEDTGALKFEIGQQNEAGNYYVRADYSGKVYEVEQKQAEAMTGLKPKDFIMGIASLVYLTTVERLEIQTEKVDAVFDIETASDNSQIYKREGSVCEEKGFKEMYAAILSVEIAEELAGELAREAEEAAESIGETDELAEKAGKTGEAAGFIEETDKLAEKTEKAEKAEAITAKNAEAPVLCIRFFRNTKQLETVEVIYYPYDENYYFIERNGMRQFLAKRETVNRAIDIIESYCSP